MVGMVVDKACISRQKFFVTFGLKAAKRMKLNAAVTDLVGQVGTAWKISLSRKLLVLKTLQDTLFLEPSFVNES